MAIAPKAERVTPADDLRQLLSQSEDRLINLSHPASVADLYGWLDQIAALLPHIQATGINLRAEEARWQSLQERLATRGSQVLRAWKGGAALRKARQAVDPDESRWWWWIDQLVAQRRRQRLRRAAVMSAAALAIVVLVGVVLQRLFPVDPAVRAAYRLQLQAETALGAGDLAGGYLALQQAIELTPDNSGLLILHGAVADLEGDQEAAEQSWQRALALLNGAEPAFLTERGLAFVRLQQPDRAIDDLNAAIALDPSSARAHLVLGSALETDGRLHDALAAYEQASMLAEAANNPELTAMARVQIANLMPRLPAAPVIEAQP